MIPLIDTSDPDFEEELLAACRDVGFVSITGHGIETSQFDEMRALLVRLFEADDQTKTAGAITRDNYRGFIPLGFFTPNRSKHNDTQGDNYEGYKLHWECPADHPARSESRLYGPNIWPGQTPEMADVVLGYWEACDRLADRLLAVFARALNVEPDEFVGWHEAPLTNMTLLHYPAQDPQDSAPGIHPHKDTNVITFLHPDPVGGLYVRAVDGSWIEASPPPDALVMNIGEMLELWSGGMFRATPHQVLNNSGKERYSYPYFVVPNHGVVVEPLLECREGFVANSMPVGPLSAEVWRTNWPDEEASDPNFDLGTLDR